MFENPRVTLKGVVKAIERDSFKSAKGEDIAFTYVYIEQEDVMRLAKVQIKPANLKIAKGDLFEGEVEIKAQKTVKGVDTIVFVYTLKEKKSVK